MSRNDLILVIRHGRRYYIAPRVNADTQWNHDFARQVAERSDRWVRSRGRALIIAHDMQNDDPSEYGVRELRLKWSRPAM